MLHLLYPGIHFFTNHPKGIIKRYKRQAKKDNLQLELKLDALRGRMELLRRHNNKCFRAILADLQSLYQYYESNARTDVVQILSGNCLSSFACADPETDWGKQTAELSGRYHCGVIITFYQYFCDNIIIAAAKDGKLLSYGEMTAGQTISGVDELFGIAGCQLPDKIMPLSSHGFIPWFEKTLRLPFLLPENISNHYELKEIYYNYRLYKPKAPEKLVT